MKIQKLNLSAVALLSFAVVFGATVSVRGAIVTAGSDVDLGSGWRSGAVPSDIDGNGVLGSDGYAFVRGPLEIVDPSYGTLSGLGTSVFNGNASYALVDDPLTTPGGAPTTVLSGTWNPSPGLGNETNIARLTLSRALFVGETIRVGLMIDNLDGAGFNSDSIRVADSGGGDSGQVAVTAASLNNRTPDWFYFDVSGLGNGATIDIFGTGGSSSTATLGSVSLDSFVPPVVPEPSTFTLAALGLFGLGRLGRRRRRS